MADIVKACPDIVRKIILRSNVCYADLQQAEEYGFIIMRFEGPKIKRQVVKATPKGLEFSVYIKKARELCNSHLLLKPIPTAQYATKEDQ